MSQSLKETIALTAAYYQQTISDAVLRMYCDDLADLPASNVISAYTAYRKNPKNRRMPMPAEIRAIANPSENRDYQIQLITDRMFAAIRTHGEDWANGYVSVFSPTGKLFFADTANGREEFLTFEDAFKASVGVEALGVLKAKRLSWRSLCQEYIAYDNPSTFKAHLRSSVERALEMNAGQTQELLSEIKNILKIEDRKRSPNIPVMALPEGKAE